MVVNCVSMDGFTVGKNVSDTDCDLPLCFGNHVLTWDNILYSIISQDNAVPSREVSAFVKGYVGKGYNFFHYSNSKFHVNLMDFPKQVYVIHPKLDGQAFEEYLNLVHFYYTMVALKMDYKHIFT